MIKETGLRILQRLFIYTSPRFQNNILSCKEVELLGFSPVFTTAFCEAQYIISMSNVSKTGTVAVLILPRVLLSSNSTL